MLTQTQTAHDAGNSFSVSEQAKIWTNKLNSSQKSASTYPQVHVYGTLNKTNTTE
jgi:hypothetical protein